MKTLLTRLTILLFGATLSCVGFFEQPKPEGTVVKPTATPWSWPATATPTPRPTWTPAQEARQRERAKELERPPVTATPTPDLRDELIRSVEDFEAWCETGKLGGAFHLAARGWASDYYVALHDFNLEVVFKGTVRSPRAYAETPLMTDRGTDLLQIASQDYVTMWSLPAGSHCIKVSPAARPAPPLKISTGQSLKEDGFTVVRTEQAGNYDIVLRRTESELGRFCEDTEEHELRQRQAEKVWVELFEVQRDLREKKEISEQARDMMQQRERRLLDEHFKTQALVAEYRKCTINVQVLTYFPEEN